MKHGARSKALILADERQADFDRVAEGWRKEFEPTGYQEERLVEILVRNDWFFQRADRLWQEAQASGDDQHTLELMQRYRTTAERSFFRALAAVRGLSKDLVRAVDQRAKLDREHARLEADLQAKDALISRLQEELSPSNGIPRTLRGRKTSAGTHDRGVAPARHLNASPHVSNSAQERERRAQDQSGEAEQEEDFIWKRRVAHGEQH